MTYLISKILLCLVLAFAIGLVLAWLLRRSLALSREADLHSQWTQRFRTLEQERDTQLAKIKADADEARTQVPTLEASLADRSDLIAQLQSELDGWKRRLPPLEERIRGREEAMAEMTAEGEALRAERDRLAEALAARDDQVRLHDSELKAAAERHTALEDRLAQSAGEKQAGDEAAREEAMQMKEALAACEVTIGELRSLAAAREQDAEAAQAQLRQRDEAMAELEVALGEARAESERVAEGIAEGDRRVRELGDALAASEGRLAEVERRARDADAWRERYENLHREHAAALAAAPAERPAWLIERPADGDLDDLKHVRGIGPVLEKTLNDIGVYLYRQLAELDEAGIEWLARNVNTFPGRIRRDRWVEQASELMLRKYGDEV